MSTVANTTRPDIWQKPNAVHMGALGMSLGLLLLVSYVLCILLGMAWPDWGLHRPWLEFLPGFTWLTWPSFLLGAAETFGFGWYVALVFAPIYNFFSRAWR